MNREQAIRLLTQQLNRIDNNFDPIHWTETTQGLISRIFPQTAQDKRDQLDEISYRANTPHSFPELEEAAMGRGKNRARQYINSYIEDIQNFGVEANSNGSDHPIISLIKNGYFWTAIVAIGSLSYYTGNYVGTAKFDSEKLELYNKANELQNLNQELNEQRRTDKFKISADSVTIIKLSDSIKGINKEMGH